MNRSSRSQWASLALGLAVGFAVACDPGDFSLDPNGGGGGEGPVCYVNSECAPDDCCGEGTSIVHSSLAPSCSGVQCSGPYPDNTINQGQCIPYCRGSRCTAACS